jgi:hypothetical protein
MATNRKIEIGSGPTGPTGPQGITGPTGPSLWVETGTNIYYDSGNVGIGTDTPSESLDVAGNLIIGDDKNTPSISFRGAVGSGIGEISYKENDSIMRYYCEADEAHAFLNGRSEPLFYILDDSGTTKIGANTTTPSYTFDVDGTLHGSQGREPTDSFINDGSRGNQTQDDWYSALSPYLPNTGDSMIVSGSYRDISDSIVIVNKVERKDTDEIYIYVLNRGTGVATIIVKSGVTSDLSQEVSITW